MGFSQRLQRAWYRADGKDWLSLALLDVSWVYGGLLKLRKKLYASGVMHSTSVSVPVIVVGNVIAGGAGKTPVVIEIVQHLQRRGLRPGVVSRGYGRESSAVIEVSADTPVSASGDEPALIFSATQTPVFVAADRAQAAQALLAAHPQVNVIVCDDGLQHLALRRDIEICVMDERGLGNGRLQPAGPLREPWPRLTENTTQFLLHRGDFSEGFAIERQLAAHAIKSDGSTVPLSDLSGQSLIALAGIAQPESFFQMLRDQGVALQETVALPDHYDFNSTPRKFHAGEVLICTEKDVLKLRQASWAKGWEILCVPLLVALPEAFYSALEAALNEKLSFPPAQPHN
jgi:tetraacyldisaccharide 4'-kinase